MENAPPEALRRDESVPWQEVEAFASGQRHAFRVKTIGPVLGRQTGAQLVWRMVVIAPLGCRRRDSPR